MRFFVRIIPGDERDSPGQGGIIQTTDGPFAFMVIPVKDNLDIGTYVGLEEEGYTEVPLEDAEVGPP